jgi:hypothetical protein
MEDVFTTARQFPLFSLRSIQSKSNRPISLLPLLILFFHLCEVISVSLLSPDYPTKTLYVCLLYCVYSIFQINLILPDLIRRIISLRCKSHEIICCLYQSHFVLSLRDPTTFRSQLPLNSLTLIVKTKLETHKQQQAN